MSFVFSGVPAAGRGLAGGRRIISAILVALLCVAPLVCATADQRWVTDEIDVDVRRGKSLQHGIVRMVPSGTAVEVLEQDRAEGYSRIRLPGGAEGWILTRYLVDQAPARVALPGVVSRLERTTARNSEAEAEVKELRSERDRLAGELAAVTSSRDAQGQELAEVRRLSAGAIDLNNANRTLQAQLAEAEQRASDLGEANRRLEKGSNRDWFLTGAGTVIVGILLGLVLPRLRFKRRSGWERF